jgi:hypothetical protein
MAKITKEQEIIDILQKMNTNKLVMPDGWSDDRQLGGANISYKTYSNGKDYFNLDITIEDTHYSVMLRSGRIVVEAPLAKQMNATKALEIVKTIYQEATSPESLIEGEASLRANIASAKKDVARRKLELRKLEEELKQIRGN